MPDFDRIREIKEAAQRRLLAIPGVHAVGIGAKYVHGQNTAEPAIIVFVEKKKPVSELKPYEVIPPEIDGVKTDVVEAEKPELHVDPDEDKYRPLDGGVQLQAGISLNGNGTLGCIAHTDEPEPKIVALTCQHVLTMWQGTPTSLIVTVSPDQHTLTFSGSNTPGSLIVLDLTIMPVGPGPSQDLDLFWITDNSDTLATVASKVAAGINALSNPAVSATSSGPAVSIVWASGFIVLVPDCFVYDVRQPDPSADLSASIAGGVISLSGRVSGDNYGIYTNVNSGRDQPTFGVYTSVGKNDPLTSVASSVATSVNAQHIPGVTASASGPNITITGAQEVECIVTSDARVGQPDNTFCSKCSACCDHRIGQIIDARLNIDIGIIQLDPGKEYKAEIEGIGIVTGTHEVTEAEAISGTYQLRKRGRTTLLTTGNLRAVQIDGDISMGDAPAKRLFHRHYTGAFTVMKSGPDPFSQPGDSGSAVVNSSGEVVGILFGGGSTLTWATPIDSITNALDLIVETATSAGVVRTVPAPSGVHMAMNGGRLAAGGAAAPFAPAEVGDWNRMQEMEREVTASPTGQRYADLVRRHFTEAQELINKNRRVATVWHRNGGPQIVQSLLQMARHHDRTIPAEINGSPLADCLARIQTMLTRYASPALSHDLREYGTFLRRLAGLTYPQVLAVLQDTATE